MLIKSFFRKFNIESFISGVLLVALVIIYRRLFVIIVGDPDFEDFVGFYEGRDDERVEAPVYFHAHKESKHQHENRTEADRLAEKVRVLCWVLTTQKNHNTKAVHVKATWGRRCNKLIFMSDYKNISLPSVKLNVQSGRTYLWNKTKSALKYLYDHYLDQFDWFMKADDDTFVVVENLRYMLSIYKPSSPVYFGSKFKIYNQPYMSGGAGYVLSKKALSLFVEKGLTGEQYCKKQPTGNEDTELGRCLTKSGVMTGDSRDSGGHGRFFPFEVKAHFIEGAISPKLWYWNYTYYPIKNGPECCSDLAISFHYVPPRKMYAYEYMVYHLHPYGIKLKDVFPPQLPPDTDSIPELA